MWNWQQKECSVKQESFKPQLWLTPCFWSTLLYQSSPTLFTWAFWYVRKRWLNSSTVGYGNHSAGLKWLYRPQKYIFSGSVWNGEQTEPKLRVEGWPGYDSRVHWKKVQDKGQGTPCREKPLQKSGLEPAAPNRLADRKHCALSTHPNPHLHGDPGDHVDGDLDESIKRSASDRLGDLVPQVRARTSAGVFRDMALLGLCLELSFSEPKFIAVRRVMLTKVAPQTLSMFVNCDLLPTVG